MTRRILLTLADDTTATECGACDAKRLGSDSAWWCDHFGGMLSDTCDEVAQRDEACIAAEAAAARMVEIAHEDAALGPWVVSGAYTDEHAAAAERIERALVEHGKVQP